MLTARAVEFVEIVWPFAGIAVSVERAVNCLEQAAIKLKAHCFSIAELTD